ncbi:taurine transport system substrate-binding protein [Limimaricola soesokkakensis]|uniref:Taurine transport system substrate-binding protein n=1 Tax=Limimaricola soesokkakensis TaxID=1343159 RepID=A0A1X6ZB07_9RHOB|nr:taurine ABC transporter substrate-binding protein [Limimaricola soesokkakensis]PSK86430.1 taurine transport system substrate-binding protein [Limimaricola soesokkakensis]SLN46019.1 Taurine-binding periplasmic protein precursor [Limimaricola soesokkakensis]
MTRTTTRVALALTTFLTAGSAQAETVTIGHFGNPTPMQVALAEGRFDEATGWDIEWRKFGSGSEVIAAMASGDIKLAELGSSPLAIATSQGVELEMFMLAQVLGSAESLIARDGAEIETLEDLAGKRVAVPVGSTAHFSLMGALDHAGIDASDLTLLNMPPDQIAAAWEQGAIDAAFIWQPVQNQILETGTRLATSAETAEWGFPTFDAWVVNAEFAAENAEAVAAFARTMDEANAAYLADPAAWTAESEPVQTIAAETGADAAQIPTILEGFTFVPLSEQLGETWLGSAHETMRDTAAFLKEAGRIDQVAEDYSGFVNTEIGTAATQ